MVQRIFMNAWKLSLPITKGKRHLKNCNQQNKMLDLPKYFVDQVFVCPTNYISTTTLIGWLVDEVTKHGNGLPK